MIRVVRWVLGKAGWDIRYVCTWGSYRFRYDARDHAAGRPIHPDMSVAPPWANLTLVRRRVQ